MDLVVHGPIKKYLRKMYISKLLPYFHDYVKRVEEMNKLAFADRVMPEWSPPKSTIKELIHIVETLFATNFRDPLFVNTVKASFINTGLMYSADNNNNKSFVQYKSHNKLGSIPEHIAPNAILMVHEDESKQKIYNQYRIKKEKEAVLDNIFQKLMDIPFDDEDDSDDEDFDPVVNNDSKPDDNDFDASEYEEIDTIDDNIDCNYHIEIFILVARKLDYISEIASFF
jgi:hypothetical protein